MAKFQIFSGVGDKDFKGVWEFDTYEDAEDFARELAFDDYESTYGSADADTIEELITYEAIEICGEFDEVFELYEDYSPEDFQEL